MSPIFHACTLCILLSQAIEALYDRYVDRMEGRFQYSCISYCLREMLHVCISAWFANQELAYAIL